MMEGVAHTHGAAVCRSHSLHLPHPMSSPTLSLPLFCFFSFSPFSSVSTSFSTLFSQSIIKGLLFRAFSLQSRTRVPSSTLVDSTPISPTSFSCTEANRPDTIPHKYQPRSSNQPNCGRMLCLKESVSLYWETLLIGMKSATESCCLIIREVGVFSWSMTSSKVWSRLKEWALMKKVEKVASQIQSFID